MSETCHLQYCDFVSGRDKLIRIFIEQLWEKQGIFIWKILLIEYDDSTKTWLYEVIVGVHEIFIHIDILKDQYSYYHNRSIFHTLLVNELCCCHSQDSFVKKSWEEYAS